MNQSRSSKKQGRAQPKAKNASKNKPKSRKAPAAEYTDYSGRIGMRDLRAHTVSWVTGFVYVGDGTNGATNSVYFRCNGADLIVPSTSGGGQTPILGAETNLGQSYVSDIEKHYSRKRLNRLRLHIVSVQPGTSNSMVAAVAPVRGCGGSGDTVAFWGATTAAPTLQNVMGMSGVKSLASWETTTIDMTHFIAGGSGPRQNEFSINRDGDSAGGTWGGGNLDLIGIAPAAFVVSGSNSTTALRGTNTHFVVVETTCDYLDFLGGMPNATPLSMVAITREEMSAVLRLILTSPEKSLRDTALCRALVRQLGHSGGH